jgi:hypothetical protein
MTEVKTTTVARINQVDIVVIENGEKRVAIKPLCDAIGIDFSSQLQKIKNDPILGSTVGMITTVGADEKSREMQTIPFKYVFGWLFQIDSRKVKEEAREMVLKYQNECYDVLYNHFTVYADFVKHKQEAMQKQIDIVMTAKRNYSEAHRVLRDAETSLQGISKLTLSDFDVEKRQLKMFLDEEMEG